MEGLGVTAEEHENMSKTGELLASKLKVHNVHGLLSLFGEKGKTDVAVYFSGAGDSRSMRVPGSR